MRVQRLWPMLAALFVFGCSSEPAIAPLDVGSPAPSFKLTSATSGDVVASDSLRGQVVVINFWSTSCANCIREMEDLNEIHASGQAKVVGIALDDDRSRVQTLIDHKGVDYPVLMGDQATFERFDGFSIPYTLVLDRSQTIRKRFFGRMTHEQFDEVLKAISSGSDSVARLDN